jgi:hypothetical protein
MSVQGDGKKRRGALVAFTKGGGWTVGPQKAERYIRTDRAETVIARDGRVVVARRTGAHDQLAKPPEEIPESLGRAYVEGRLSLEEVSSSLGLPLHDTVALIERSGFHRPLERIRLSEDKRQQLLARIAEQVGSQQAQVWHQPPDSLLDREVVASQRIENVDARPWIFRRG